MSEKIVVLTVQSQRVPGEKLFRLHKKRVVLGSATSSDVRLDDASVSPVHAILEVSGIDGKPVIYDLASDTGVQINGQPSIQATVSTGDKIQIGPYFITVRVQELSEVPKPPPQIVRESLLTSGNQRLFVSEKEDLAPLLLEDESQVIDVFDRRPESALSLQVVMFYQDTILDVEHFVKEKRVVVGPGSRDDFSIPGTKFDLVTNDGSRYYLNLQDQMDGVLSQNGRVTRVKELLAGLSTSGAKSYPLADKDFAKVKVGDVSFFLNFTPAPPKLKPARLMERDPFFLKVWFGSLALTVAALVGMSSATVDPTIEIEQLPERVATIIFESRPPVVRLPAPPKVVEPVKEEPVKVAEKKPEPPKVVKVDVKPEAPKTPAPKNPTIGEKPEKPIQKAAAKPKPPVPAPPAKVAGPVKRASGQEGEGAKAKGPEGTRGAPNKPKSDTHQTMAQRPGEGPKKANVASSGRGQAETDGLGVVDMFRSNKGMLSKVLAGGSGAANAAAKLEGYSGFTTEGAGGLGAAGVGSGGGGTSMGLGGLSDKGAGGGKQGTGLGALGSGGNILGGKGRLAIDSGGTPEPIVLGAIDTDAIAREIAKHRDEIKYCYEKEINAERPDLAGRVGVRFVIGASGSVTQAGVSSTSLRNAATERCVLEVIRRIQFPPVRGGGIAEVTYPFVFKPSNK